MGEAIAAAGETDALEVMRRGAGFWLDACSDPEVERIVLVDAPAVLGWTRWSEIGNRYNIGLVRALLTAAIETGRIPPQPVEATALTMLGAMREATLYIARSEQREQAREDAGAVMNRLIDALASQKA
jgi:hypothetical protein